MIVTSHFYRDLSIKKGLFKGEQGNKALTNPEK